MYYTVLLNDFECFYYMADRLSIRCVQDLMTNPLIVPVKILRGHKVVDYQGVLDVAFHPTQPWLFSAGADSEIHMYTNC